MSMYDALGAMRARVTLLQPVRVDDGLGGAALSWESAGDAWAAVVAGAATEHADYDASVSTTEFSVTINRRDDVRAGWRLAWGARMLRVAALRDDGGARVSLLCVEERL